MNSSYNAVQLNSINFLNINIIKTKISMQPKTLKFNEMNQF